MFGGGSCSLHLLPFSQSYIQDDIAESITTFIININILKTRISKIVQITHPFIVFGQNHQKLNHVHTFKIWPTEETMNKCSKTEPAVFGRSTNSAEPSTAKENPEFCLLTRCCLPVVAVSALVQGKE